MPKDPVIDAELLDCLAPATVKNFVDRDIEPFKTHLQYCAPLSQTDFHAAFLASLEGPRVSKTQSAAMVRILLAHLGDHNLQLKYSSIWNAIRESSEMLLVEDWQSTQCKGFTRGSWIENNGGALSLFTDLELCKTVDDEIAAAEQAALQVVDEHGCAVEEKDEFDTI